MARALALKSLTSRSYSSLTFARSSFEIASLVIKNLRIMRRDNPDIPSSAITAHTFWYNFMEFSFYPGFPISSHRDCFLGRCFRVNPSKGMTIHDEDVLAVKNAFNHVNQFFCRFREAECKTTRGLLFCFLSSSSVS